MNNLKLGQEPNWDKIDSRSIPVGEPIKDQSPSNAAGCGNIVAKVPELVQSVLQSVTRLSAARSSGRPPPSAMNLMNMAKNLPVNTNPMAPANPDLTAQTLKGGEKHGLP